MHFELIMSNYYLKHKNKRITKIHSKNNNNNILINTNDIKQVDERTQFISHMSIPLLRWYFGKHWKIT